MLRRWTTFVVGRPRAVIAVVLGLTLLLGAQARHLRLDIRERDQLPQDHPYVRLYNRINDVFGGGAMVVIGVVPRAGTAFAPEPLGALVRVTRRLETDPALRGATVWSLASPRVATFTTADGALAVEPLMPAVPADAAGIARLRRAVLADPRWSGTLVAVDGSAVAVVVDLPVDARYPDVDRAIEAAIAAERSPDLAVVAAGGPILLATLDRATAQMAFLFPVAVLIIGLVHWEAFRTLQAMVLPLATALLSVVWALGLMGLLRLPLDTWSAVTPIAILAVAAGHAVQLLKRYYEDVARVGDRAAAVVSSMAAVGPVTVTAGVIAAAGFASLAVFAVASVRTFGLLMAGGILSSLVIELTFIPACRVLLPAPQGREAARERESRWLDPMLAALATAVTTRPRAVLAAAAAVLAALVAGAPRLHVDGSLRALFPPGAAVRQADAAVNARFGGTSTVKILVEGAAPGAIHDPAVLRAMADLEAMLAAEPGIGATTSIVDHLRAMHGALAPDEAREDPLPLRRALVAQYLLLASFSGGDELSGLIDADGRRAVITGLSRSDEAGFASRLFARVTTAAAQRFRGLPVTVSVAGGSLGAQAALNAVIVAEKVRNVVQVACIIALLSIVVFRSVAAAFLVLTPLALAVAVGLGVMGWSGTWLTMSTATTTAMGVSIGADFAIYLLFRLREEIAARGLADGVRVALRTSGKAVLFVSSAVTLGYLVLVTSGFSAWVHLGGITALLMAVAALATLTVLPALVILLRPRFLVATRGRRLVPATVPA